MTEIYPTTHFDLIKGSFPLNHDSVLKVEYHNGVGLKYQYFTCRSQDCGNIANLFNAVLPIKKVTFCSVDEMTNYF